MLNVALAFGGGFFARETASHINLPKVNRNSEGVKSFKLWVRAVAAAVPALSKPGVVTQRRPRLEVTLAGVEKETELADYVADDESSPEAGACARECPWRFGDTLTFVATIEDVVGAGFKFRLRCNNDVFLGPVQFQLSSLLDLGEGHASLRHRVLPACVRDRHSSSADTWESPLLPIPLSHVRGGLIGADHGLGEAVAHVTVVFGMDADPEELLATVDQKERPVSDILASRADRVMKWLDTPIDLGAAGYVPSSSISSFPGDLEECESLRTPRWQDPLTSTQIRRVVDKAKMREPKAQMPRSALPGPELNPEGWVSRQGPNGRLYWHHRSLGPAPWEEDASLSSVGRGVSFGPLVSPSLSSEGWVCREGPNGRKFWHHTALGRAPWDELSKAHTTL